MCVYIYDMVISGTSKLASFSQIWEDLTLAPSYRDPVPRCGRAADSRLHGQGRALAHSGQFRKVSELNVSSTKF